MKNLFDKNTKFIIQNSRRVLSRIDRIKATPYCYKLLYKYIEHALKEDYKITDEFFKNESLNQIDNIKTALTDLNIWIMWWQGLKDAPGIVQKNIAYLQKIIGKKRIKIITKNNYERYTNIAINLKKNFREGNISLTNWSDIVRFNILYNNGGIWIDATATVSEKFIQYIKENNKLDFITVSSSKPDYHWISYGKWTAWLIGGKKRYPLFKYICLFYENYFMRHKIIIDYYVIDDIIAHFYKNNSTFYSDCNKISQNWHPYYWVSNFNNNYNRKFINKFNNLEEYSVQKLTYKYKDKIEKNNKSFLSFLLSSEEW